MRVGEVMVGKKGNRTIKARFIRLGEDDGSFDRDFWAEVGSEGRFAAAWEMVAEVDLMRGKDGRQPRLQRSVTSIRRREG